MLALDRFWRILDQIERVLTVARCPFVGKSSPVHFFWGSFDLAVTRFSGRPAPRDGPAFVRDAYSQDTTYERASSLAGWDRAALERPLIVR